MNIETIQHSDYCANQCKYYNHYDGWCYHYDKDTCEIDLTKCEILKKELQE